MSEILKGGLINAGIPPGETNQVRKTTFDYNIGKKLIKIQPGSEPLHLISGDFEVIQIWDQDSLTTQSIADGINSYHGGHQGNTSLSKTANFTQEDRDRIGHIEKQLEDLGKKVDQLLKKSSL
jgi:hypothetical protein